MLFRSVSQSRYHSGFSGISGYSGFSGVSGYSGLSGYSGYSGVSGFSGLPAGLSSLNWSQNVISSKVVVTTSTANVASVTITANGNPIVVTAYGDVESANAGGWTRLQLYRGSNAIGSIVHT